MPNEMVFQNYEHGHLVKDKMVWQIEKRSWSLSPNLTTDRTHEEQVNDIPISKEEEFAKNMVVYDFTSRNLSWSSCVHNGTMGVHGVDCRLSINWP